MTLSPIVLIVAADEVETLKTDPGVGTDIRVFADTDAIRALQAITREPPRVVVLGRAFVETEQGASLVNTIKAMSALTRNRVTADLYSPPAQGAQPPTTPTPSMVTLNQNIQRLRLGCSFRKCRPENRRPPPWRPRALLHCKIFRLLEHNSSYAKPSTTGETHNILAQMRRAIFS